MKKQIIHGLLVTVANRQNRPIILITTTKTISRIIKIEVKVSHRTTHEVKMAIVIIINKNLLQPHIQTLKTIQIHNKLIDKIIIIKIISDQTQTIKREIEMFRRLITLTRLKITKQRRETIKRQSQVQIVIL